MEEEKEVDLDRKFFLERENCEKYTKMCEGYENSYIMKELQKRLKKGKSILEIGSGPGTDLETLQDDYDVTGSDVSSIWLENHQKKNSKVSFVILDAITLEGIDRKFDCIYSNKVLMHLKKDNMIESLKRQKEVLLEGGILFHSLWKGEDTVDTSMGVRINYYSMEKVTEILSEIGFEVLESVVYKEMKDNDSFFIVSKKL